MLFMKRKRNSPTGQSCYWAPRYSNKVPVGSFMVCLKLQEVMVLLRDGPCGISAQCMWGRGVSRVSQVGFI
jgi:hypothetical protein